jgi:hypothetical protein
MGVGLRTRWVRPDVVSPQPGERAVLDYFLLTAMVLILAMIPTPCIRPQ